MSYSHERAQMIIWITLCGLQLSLNVLKMLSHRRDAITLCVNAINEKIRTLY